MVLTVREEWDMARDRVLAKHHEELEAFNSDDQSNALRKKKMKALIQEEFKAMAAEGILRGPPKVKYDSDGNVKKRKRQRNLGRDSKEKLREAVRRACEGGVGPRIAVDMEFEDQDSFRRRPSLMRQLQEIYASNMSTALPCKLSVCGVSESFREDMEKKLDIGSWEKLGLAQFTQKSVAEIFSKDEVVYLSADATVELESVESNKVYVIGGIVDRNNPKETTSAKAARLGFACVKLPLDAFLSRQARLDVKRELTVNQVARIIQDLASSNCWDFSLLRNVPLRLNAKLKLEQQSNSVESSDTQIKQQWGRQAVVVIGAEHPFAITVARNFRSNGWSVVLVGKDGSILKDSVKSVRSVALKDGTPETYNPVVISLVEDCSLRGGTARVVSVCQEVFQQTNVGGIVCVSSNPEKSIEEDVFAASLRLLNVPITYRLNEESKVVLTPLGGTEESEKIYQSAFFAFIGPKQAEHSPLSQVNNCVSTFAPNLKIKMYTLEDGEAPNIFQDFHL